MRYLIFVLITFFTNSLRCIDRFLDINLTTDFSNLKQRSHVDFNSQAVVPFSKQAFLLNPRITIFFDGSLDVSLASGLRHQLKYGTLGHHVFWNSTATRDARFHQIGHSLEFLTDQFDYRVNYYHPITKDQQYKNFLVSPHRWVESEMIYKHRIFHVGAGPKYNLFEKAWGVQAKLSFPFQYFSIGSLVSYDTTNKFSSAISISFRLYGTPRKKSIDSPIHYQSRVLYSKELIFIPPPPESKKREDDKNTIVKTDKEPSNLPIANATEQPTNNQPVVIPPTKPKSWWNFFFGTQTQQHPTSILE